MIPPFPPASMQPESRADLANTRARRLALGFAVGIYITTSYTYACHTNRPTTITLKCKKIQTYFNFLYTLN